MTSDLPLATWPSPTSVSLHAIRISSWPVVLWIPQKEICCSKVSYHCVGIRSYGGSHSSLLLDDAGSGIRKRLAARVYNGPETARQDPVCWSLIQKSHILSVAAPDGMQKRWPAKTRWPDWGRFHTILQSWLPKLLLEPWPNAFGFLFFFFWGGHCIFMRHQFSRQ